MCYVMDASAISRGLQTLLGDQSELSTADVPERVATEACFRETLRCTHLLSIDNCYCCCCSLYADSAG